MGNLKFIQVVRGDKDQYDVLLPLWRAFIRDIDANRNKVTTDEFIEFDLTRRVAIQGDREDMHFVIAYLDDAAIGFSNFAIDLGTIYGLIERGGGTFMGYYIAPEYRRRGYARQMFEHCESVLINDGAKYLYTCPEPNIGEPFWIAMGFKNSGIIDPDDKLPIYMKDCVTIRELPLTAADEKSAVCRTILDALPDWFGIPEAIADYEKSVRDQAFWAAYHGTKPVGFIALSEHNSHTSEIDVMGVLSDFHRRGVGKRLFAAAERYCIDGGKSVLLVKTLDFSHPDPFYAKTREYYLAMGFVPLQVLEGYWDEKNPCLLMGKWL